MKQSRYALLCKLDEDYALFNSATGRFATCDEHYANVFKAVSGDEKALDELADAGFLVEDDRDELSEQQRRFLSARTAHDQLFLSLAPTYACNCRCAYCYEQDKLTAKSLMSPEVENAIFSFVEERFEATGFTRLFVEWYGGDPQLCLGLVSRLSERLIGFCDARGVEYNAMMLSNSTRIGDDEADLLLCARVSSMLVTIDGPEDLHNKRRPAIDVDNPYQAIMSAIDALQERGIAVSAAMNADRVNMARLDELRCALASRNVSVTPAKLNDYAHTFNCPGEHKFCKPGFDLYTHEEFAHANYEALAREGFTAPRLAGLLSASDHFCSGHLESSYVIDAFGDVYKCDGWMGDKSRSLFNLLDWASSSDPDSIAVTDAVSSNPLEDTQCRECNLLPICWGNCSWERELCHWPCHPLRYTLDRYLRSYRDCFPPRTSPFTVLA